MGFNYTKHVQTKVTPQSEPIPGKTMVKGDAGGYVFEVDKWARLRRFLILGSEGGTYYASEKKLTLQNVGVIQECLEENPARTVQTIVEISDGGLAPKNDPAVFALALAASYKGTPGHTKEVRREALGALNKVARVGTHLMQFVSTVNELRGWGRGLRDAVANWYTSPDKDVNSIAYQLCKYQSREGWSQRDVLRLAHPKTVDAGKNLALKWAVGKSSGDDITSGYMPEVIVGFEKAKKASTPQEIVHLVQNYNLPRECIPTQFLNSVEVWDALLEKMPITAMIRNLGKMTAVGLLKPLSAASRLVKEKVQNVGLLQKGRVHPMALLLANRTYAQGHGEKGKLTWSPDPGVVNALDDAFYLAFKAVEPTGKRFLLAIDTSGSMGGSHVIGSTLTAREAAGAMALVTMNTEPETHVIGFTGRGFSVGGSVGMWGGQGGVEVLSLHKGMRLREVCSYMERLPYGPTDCSLPMQYGMARGIEFDAVIVYTDSETWHGSIHPCQALRQYREKMRIPAKMVVQAFVSNSFTIADPSDGGMLDICGLDASSPQLVSSFIKGDF